MGLSSVYNEHKKNKFITRETFELHDLVTELYEQLMDREDKVALVTLESIAEKVRSLKADLSNKEE